jgi:hypothetical protein
LDLGRRVARRLARLGGQEVEQLLGLRGHELGHESPVLAAGDLVEDVRSVAHDGAEVEEERSQRSKLWEALLTRRCEVKVVAPIGGAGQGTDDPPQRGPHMNGEHVQSVRGVGGVRNGMQQLKAPPPRPGTVHDPKTPFQTTLDGKTLERDVVAT